MKSLKSIICLLLAGSLLFAAACGNKPGNIAAAAEGRYVESDITPPVEGRFTSFISADGTIVCFDAGLAVRYESTDGGASWSENPGPGSGSDRFLGVQGGALLPDGSLLVFIQGEGLVTVAPDGNVKPYPVEDIDKAIADGENIMLSQLQVMGERLFLSYNVGGMVSQSVRAGRPIGGQGPDTQSGPQGDSSGGQGPQGEQPRTAPGGTTSGTVGGGAMSMRPVTLLCDVKTGQVVAKPDAESVTACAYDETYFYLMDMNNNVSIYNLSDGAPSGKPVIKFNDSATNAGMFGANMRIGGFDGNSLACGGDGSLFAAQDGEMKRADAGGNVDVVLESTAYSIGAPRNTVDSVLVLDDGSIVVNLLGSNQMSRLYRYVWDDNATVNPDKTITVWSLEDNNFVRAAIAQLRKSHPDSYIKYEVALDGSNAMSAADAIRTLNTRLLSGGGPDVIILDGCSIESYAGRGMLMDMSNLIDTGGVFDNLLSPYIDAGKLYCLPTQFMMPLLLGSPNALEKAQTLDDLVALVISGNDATPVGGPGQGPGLMTGLDEDQRAALHFDDLKELCNILWGSGAPDIINNNTLDTASLRSYLEAVKSISDKYGLAEQEQGPGGRVGMSVAFSDGGTATTLPGSLVRYTMRMTNYAAFSASNLHLLQRMIEDADSAMKLFPGLTLGTWQPSTVVSISADADNPDFAAQLVQAMLSEDVQKLNYGTGLPVTRSGVAAQIEAINDLRSQFGETAFEFDAETLISGLRVPSMVDTVLTDMMWNSVVKCCKGEIDIDGAVREIEQSIKNYLAERA